MSAERLREAAALMRSRAERATPGDWRLFDDGIFVNRQEDAIPGSITYDAQVLEVGDADFEEFVTESDAEHIASWHPAVALAVADWLDRCADRRDITSDVRIEHDAEEQDWYMPALAVADAYLQGGK